MPHTDQSNQENYIPGGQYPKTTFRFYAQVKLMSFCFLIFMRKTVVVLENALKTAKQWHLQPPPERKQQQQ